MHSVWLGHRFFVSSSTQVPPAESEKIVEIFVFAAVVSTIQFRQVSIFVVFVTAVV